MTNQEIFSSIAKALDVPPSTISMETVSNDLESWDSLGHISILMELQTAFDGQYEETDAFASAVGVRDLVLALKGSTD